MEDAILRCPTGVAMRMPLLRTDRAEDFEAESETRATARCAQSLCDRRCPSERQSGSLKSGAGQL